MTKPRLRRSALALVLAALAAAVPAAEGPEAVEQAWELLFANRAEEAAAAFADLGGGGTLDALAALEGRLACAQLKGDFEAAWAVAQEQTWAAAALPGGIGALFFERLQRLAAALGREKDMFELAQGLLGEGKTAGEVRCLAGDTVHMGLLLRRRYEEADALEARDGYVRLFAAVIGPFRDYRDFQVDLPGPVQQDPGRGDYEDALGRPVAVHMNVRADRRGSLDFEEELPGTFCDAGAYALALVESDEAREAVLSVAAPFATIIWLNGLPVFRGDQFAYEYRRPTRELRVGLKAGVNTLLVHCSARASLRLRLLDPEGGVCAGLTWREHGAAPPAVCLGLRGYLASAVEQPPALQAIEKLDAPIQAKWLWLAQACEDAREIARCRGIWEAFLQGHPDSLHILAGAAFARLRESSLGVDDPQRLQQEAMALVNRMLEIEPDCYAALLALARHHVNNRQLDQAVPLLKRAVELYPKAPPAHRDFARVCKEKGWHELAEAEYRSLVAISPEWGVEFAEFAARTGRKDLARELRDKAWEEGRLAASGRIAELVDRGDWAAAREALAAWRAANPGNRRWCQRRAQEIARASGDDDSLLAILKERAGEQPELDDPARELAEFHLRQSNADEALKWFAEADRRGSAAEKIDLGLRRRIRNLQDAAWDLLGYDLSLQDMAAEAVRKEDHPRSNYAVILRVEVHRVHLDRSAESLVHQAIKVFDKEGVDALSEMSVPQGSDALLFCRTVQPDGSVFVPTSAENLQLGKAASMYAVAPGSVLEYAYRREWPGGPAAGFRDRFAFEQIDVPVVRSRYVLILPKTLRDKLSIRVHPEDLAPEVREAGGEVVYTWDTRDRKAVPRESFLPSEEETLSGLQIEVRGREFSGRRWLGRAEPIRSDEAVRKAAAEIAGGGQDQAARVRRVHSWITSVIKDTPGARTARDTLALGSGDPQAKLRLCRAMLDALGIEAHIAWPNPGLIAPGQVSPRRRAMSAAGFAGSLLHVRIPEQEDIWLDFYPPARNFRFEDLPPGVLGAPALETNDGGIELLFVRGESQASRPEADIVIAIGEDGAAAVKGTLTFHGLQAGRMRTIAEQPQRGPLAMERMAAQWFPKIALDESDFPDGSEPAPQPLPARSPFIYRLRGRIQSFCRSEGERLAFNPFLQRTVQAERFATPLPRRFPFEVSGDHLVAERLTFIAPEGWCFAEVPRDACWPSDFGLYIADFTVEGRRLVATHVFILPAQVQEPRAYSAMHAWLAQIEKNERVSVSLERLPEEAAGRYRPVYDPGPAEVIDLAPFGVRHWPKGLKENGGE